MATGVVDAPGGGGWDDGPWSHKMTNSLSRSGTCFYIRGC